MVSIRPWIFISGFVLIVLVLISQYECEAKITFSFGNSNKNKSSRKHTYPSAHTTRRPISLASGRKPSGSSLATGVGIALVAAALENQRNKMWSERRKHRFDRLVAKRTTPKPKVVCTTSSQGVKICNTVDNTTPAPSQCVNTVYPNGTMICEPRKVPPPPGCFPSIVNGKTEFPRPECKQYFPELDQGKNLTKEETDMFNFLASIANKTSSSGGNQIFEGAGFSQVGVPASTSVKPGSHNYFSKGNDVGQNAFPKPPLNSAPGYFDVSGNGSSSPNYTQGGFVANIAEVHKNGSSLPTNPQGGNAGLEGLSLLDFLTLYVGANPYQPAQGRNAVQTRSGLDFNSNDQFEDSSDISAEDNVLSPRKGKFKSNLNLKWKE